MLASTLIAGVAAIYESEIGLHDWHIQGVGVPLVASVQKTRVVVASRSFVAAVSRAGDIVWRRALGRLDVPAAIGIRNRTTASGKLRVVVDVAFAAGGFSSFIATDGSGAGSHSRCVPEGHAVLGFLPPADASAEPQVVSVDNVTCAVAVDGAPTTPLLHLPIPCVGGTTKWVVAPCPPESPADAAHPVGRLLAAVPAGAIDAAEACGKEHEHASVSADCRVTLVGGKGGFDAALSSATGVAFSRSSRSRCHPGGKDPFAFSRVVVVATACGVLYGIPTEAPSRDAPPAPLWREALAPGCPIAVAPTGVYARRQLDDGAADVVFAYVKGSDAPAGCSPGAWAVDVCRGNATAVPLSASHSHVRTVAALPTRDGRGPPAAAVLHVDGAVGLPAGGPTPPTLVAVEDGAVVARAPSGAVLWRYTPAAGEAVAGLAGGAAAAEALRTGTAFRHHVANATPVATDSKLINPALVAVASCGARMMPWAGRKEEVELRMQPVLSVAVLDGVSGSVVTRAEHVHAAGTGPGGRVPLVWVENAAVYAFEALVPPSYPRYRLAALPLFDPLAPAGFFPPSAPRAAGSLSVPATVAPALLQVPTAVVALGVSASRHGLVPKVLLVAPAGGGVYALDARVLTDTRAFPLRLYTPNGTHYLSHNRSLAPCAAVTTSATELESATHAACVGADVFYRRLEPAEPFDQVPRSHSPTTSWIAVALLTAAILFLRPIAERRTLARRWA